MWASYVFTKTSLVTFSHALCRFHEYYVIGIAVVGKVRSWRGNENGQWQGSSRSISSDDFIGEMPSIT
jgi:hypothetical protein